MNTEESIYINMFGEFQIIAGDKMISTKMNRTKKVWTMLEYLITFRDRDIPQSELIEVLWGTSNVEKPAFALKTLSYRVRTTLEGLGIDYARDLIESNEGSYRWSSRFNCIVDADEFKKLFDQTQNEDYSKEELIEKYLRIIDIYKDDFLANNCFTPGLVSLQTTYRTMYIKIMHELLELLDKDEEYKRMEEICNEFFKKDIFDDEVSYYYMKVLNEQNHTKDAISYYDRINQISYQNMSKSNISHRYYESLLLKEKNDKVELKNIKQELDKTDNLAYFCTYEVFKCIYDIERRRALRGDQEGFLIMLDIEGRNNQEETMQLALNQLKFRLRKGDIITRASDSQYIILLTNLNDKQAIEVINRISKSIKQDKKVKKINYQMEKISD